MNVMHEFNFTQSQMRKFQFAVKNITESRYVQNAIDANVMALELSWLQSNHFWFSFTQTVALFDHRMRSRIQFRPNEDIALKCCGAVVVDIQIKLFKNVIYIAVVPKWNVQCFILTRHHVTYMVYKILYQCDANNIHIFAAKQIKVVLIPMSKQKVYVINYH